MTTTVPIPVNQTEVPAPAGRRIVPALIDCAPIYVDCPAWCTVDHVAENEGALEDLYHTTGWTDLYLPDTGRADGPKLLLTLRLNEDPYLIRRDGRQPGVAIDDGTDPDMLSPEQADEFADSLIAFAAQVRAHARTLAAGEARS